MINSNKKSTQSDVLFGGQFTIPMLMIMMMTTKFISMSRHRLVVNTQKCSVSNRSFGTFSWKFKSRNLPKFSSLFFIFFFLLLLEIQKKLSWSNHFIQFEIFFKRNSNKSNKMEN